MAGLRGDLQELQDRLVDDMLFGKLARGGRVRVDVADDRLVFEVETAG